MVEIIMVAAGALAALALISASQFYRQIRKAREEYEEARDVVGDVILSYNRQFERQDRRLQSLAGRTESVTSRADRSLEIAQRIEKRVGELVLEHRAILEKQHPTMSEIEEIGERLSEALESHETLNAKIVELQKSVLSSSASQGLRIQTAIPIKREKALAPLTETEMAFLNILSSQGRQTAPQMGKLVRLSREHTARVMKKLYEEGYLERDTNKIPFKYHLKAETEELLKPSSGESR